MAKGSFASEIEQWAIEAEDQVVKEAAVYARKVFHDVVDFSPFLTGRFVANWNVSPTIDRTTSDAITTKAAKKAQINARISDDYFSSHEIVTLTNSLNYAPLVEYAPGWVAVGGKTREYAPVATAIAMNTN